MHGIPRDADRRDRRAEVRRVVRAQAVDVTPRSSRPRSGSIRPARTSSTSAPRRSSHPDEVAFVSRWLGRAARGRAAGAARARRARPAAPAERRPVERSRPRRVRRRRDLAAAGARSRTPASARADFFDSLAHSAAVVGINTSALLEAAILGKSVLTPLAARVRGNAERAPSTSATCCSRTAASSTPRPRSTSMPTSSRTRSARGDEHAEQTQAVRRVVPPSARPRPAGGADPRGRDRGARGGVARAGQRVAGHGAAARPADPGGARRRGDRRHRGARPSPPGGSRAREGLVRSRGERLDRVREDRRRGPVERRAAGRTRAGTRRSRPRAWPGRRASRAAGRRARRARRRSGARPRRRSAARRSAACPPGSPGTSAVADRQHRLPLDERLDHRARVDPDDGGRVVDRVEVERLVGLGHRQLRRRARSDRPRPARDPPAPTPRRCTDAGGRGRRAVPARDRPQRLEPAADEGDLPLGRGDVRRRADVEHVRRRRRARARARKSCGRRRRRTRRTSGRRAAPR